MAKSNDVSSWKYLHAAERLPMAGLERERVPATPGVYAFYRDGRAAWLGKSANLRASISQAFATQGPSAVSPLRRSVASFLGISASATLAAGRYRPTAEDHARIGAWIRESAVAWLACATESEAVQLEARLAAEPESTRPAPTA